MATQKTSRLGIRLTESELEDIKEKAKQFGSISKFLLVAANEFSNRGDFENKQEAGKKLAEIYKDFHNPLYHISGNLNQAMKIANIYVQKSYDKGEEYETRVIPLLKKLQILCTDIDNKIDEITDILMK